MNTSLNGPPNIKGAIVVGACLALALGLAACGDDGGGGDEPRLRAAQPGDRRRAPPRRGHHVGRVRSAGGDDDPGGHDDLGGDDHVRGDHHVGRGDHHLGRGVHLLGGPLPTGLAQLGESGEKASELALEQIQGAVDEAGADHEVSVVHEDQGEDPEAAVQAASGLVHSDGASCLTGPWSAESFFETADAVAIPNKVLQIAPTPTSEETADLSDRDLVVSTALPVTLEGNAIAKAIARDLGEAEGNTVNVAATNDDYGDSLSEGFIEAWQEQDGTVGGQVVIAPPPLDSSSSSGFESSAYSGQVSQITDGSPDAVVLIVDPTTLLNLGSALAASFSWDPETAWGADELVVPGLIDEVGADVIGGMRARARHSEGGRSLGRIRPRVQVRAADRRPDPALLRPGIRRDDPLLPGRGRRRVHRRPGDGGRADRHHRAGRRRVQLAGAPEAIEALENGEDIDYTGASGPIDMDVRGAPTSGVYDIYLLTEDGLDVEGEVSVSKPNPAAP